jgi:hypothetical protein
MKLGEKLVKKFKKWNHHFTIFHTGSRELLRKLTRQEVERTSEMFMLYFSRGRIVNNSLQTSNLRQGNIKLLVASWAPLRYYFNRPSEVSVAMGEWATVNFCPCIYCVNWYQKSTIVLLNGLSSIILVHKNTPSNQNILIKVNLIRMSLIYIWVPDSYDTLIVYLSCKIAWWS